MTQMRRTLDAVRYLEQAVTMDDWTEGVVLRDGAFYGRGRRWDLAGEHVERSADAGSR